VVPSDRAYLSFTSGTTGEPQAVLAREAALTGFLAWYHATFHFGAQDRFAMLAGLGHDPLLREVFTPLLTGGRLLVPEQEWVRDPDVLADWLREHGVTVAHLSPQLARLLTADRTVTPLPELRLVALGGDVLTGADVTRLRRLAPRARLINLYGTTETPQAHGWYDLTRRRLDESGDVVPVGCGVPGSELVVVDALDRPAAVGELGEVVIRSRRLASGYLDPAATARRFAGTPGAVDPQDRIYRTGDLGRHRPDGTVVLAGRADDQVKVRGFRVELGEIEAALTGHPDVRAAAAVPTTVNGERVVRAFVAPAQPDLRVAALLDHLRSRLPEHAVPAEVSLVPAIPLTTNGKIDRRALEQTPRPQLRSANGEVRTPTERIVAEIWRSVLGRPRVDAEENFFDAGGHSLALVAVATRLSQSLDREVQIVALFQHPTIRALARHLDGDGAIPELDRADRRAIARRERLHRRSTARGSVAQPGGRHQ
jgi:amino acid adenylation domain-containing protein